jgi:uncharacterized membrane protein
VQTASEMKTIVGVFNSVRDAQEAVRELETEGVPRSDISIVANKNAAGYDTLDKTDRASDVVADAGIGAAIGGVGGLLLSAAGAITVPVIGPILAAGPIAAALTGAGVGAAAGGLIGALTESGIPEEHAGYYAEGVRRGDVLVTVKTTQWRTDRVCDILDRHNAVDVDDRVSSWRSRGWKGYREDAKPLADDELRREREYYRMPSPNYPATGTADYPGAGTTTMDRARETGRDIKEAARDAGEEVKEFGREVANKVRKGTQRATEKGRELRDEASEKTQRMSESESEEAARRRRARVYGPLM